MAFEKRYAEFVLQRANATADGRLARAQGFSRPAETAVIGDGERLRNGQKIDNFHPRKFENSSTDRHEDCHGVGEAAGLRCAKPATSRNPHVGRLCSIDMALRATASIRRDGARDRMPSVEGKLRYRRLQERRLAPKGHSPRRQKRLSRKFDSAHHRAPMSKFHFDRPVERWRRVIVSGLSLMMSS